MIRHTHIRRQARGMVAVAIIVALVLIQLIIVGLVVSGTRDHQMTIQRADTVEAFYAAEAGINMAVREIMSALDEDGDCAIGTVSHDGDDNNNAAIGDATVVVATTTSGAQTTVTSYGLAGEARRQITVVVYVDPPANFSDDFADAVITGWTSLGEAMQESGGLFHTPGSNTDCHYTIDDGTAWTNYTISVDVRSVDDDIMGISFRVQDANNYYLLRQKFGDGGDWDLDLDLYVGGSDSDLATPIANFGSSAGQVDDANQWYELKVTVSGTSIKCYVDDVLKFDVTDSTYSSGTAGLWTWAENGSEFDNVLVE